MPTGLRTTDIVDLKSTKGRVAIVHDALVNTGGAERVALYMHEAFPDAPIFTSVYLPNQTFSQFASVRVIPMWQGRFAKTEKRVKQLFPLWALGFRRLNLEAFDFVLSSSTWGAKLVRHAKPAAHACYCYAPFRLLWKNRSYSESSLPFGSGGRRLLNPVIPFLRSLDYRITQKISRLATTCGNMARELEQCYRRRAEVIHAPIRLQDYAVDGSTGSGGYYLTVSRLISHKRVDLAIQACNRLKKNLIVVGDGPEYRNLSKMCGDTARLAGRVAEGELRRLYRECKAVIFPSEEDYGLVPLEAQASGRPVIAYGAGGALETVTPNLSGLFFNEQSAEAVVDAIQLFERSSFDPTVIRKLAEAFDVEQFKTKLRRFLLEA